MKRIEATTLEEAYTLAASTLDCSVTQLEVQVVQHPTSGVLGLFKKPAIIVAVCKGRSDESAPAHKVEPPEAKRAVYEKPAYEKPAYEKPAYEKPETPVYEEPQKEVKPAYSRPKEQPKPRYKEIEKSDFDKLFDDDFRSEPASSFDEPIIDDEKACFEIEERLNELFKNTCYKIDPIKVSMYDERTIKVFIDGEDAALLIGKDGYRYKALSYILFNWVNPLYGYLLRLEVAEFLQNQEEMIARYLEPVIDQIEATGRGQTRTLDGVLVQIALKELRGRFPGKYVAIKTTPDGKGKFVVVNDFIRKNDRGFY